MDLDTFIKIILPLLTLFLGTLFGLILSIIKTNITHRKDIINKIIDEYFDAREIICETLSKLTNLKISSNDKIDSEKYLNDISKLYFKYYDFLPKQILQNFHCLHACLSDKENRLFTIKEDQLFLVEDSEIHNFLKEILITGHWQNLGCLWQAKPCG